jgi:hypothetical protein
MDQFSEPMSDFEAEVMYTNINETVVSEDDGLEWNEL